MSASKNMREAILKAADWIEKNPELYDFSQCEIPDCGTPGCMVGWVGHFLGATGPCWAGFADKIIGVNSEVFMDRLHRIDRENGICETWGRKVEAGTTGYRQYISARAVVPQRLRLYADKYHPAEPLKELPSGAQVCELILAKPSREHEAA